MQISATVQDLFDNIKQTFEKMAIISQHHCFIIFGRRKDKTI